MGDTTNRRTPDGKKRRKRLEETQVTGALAKRQTEDGRRRIKLTDQERRDLNRSQRIGGAVLLFLDLEGDHTWEEITQELGISVMALKDLTKTELFIEKYDQHFAELGHDPRLKSAQAAIVDLLPMAVRELKALLSGGDVPASVKFRAIEKVIELNGVDPTKGGAMDRNELMNFLREANISITQNNNITAPGALEAPYQGNIDAYVDGRWGEIESQHAESKGDG